MYVIKKKYLSSDSSIRRIHSILATFFLNTKYLLKSKNVKNKNTNSESVKVNPLGNIVVVKKVSMRNLLRYLSELPRHLIRANRMDEFTTIVCDMRWIATKACLLSCHDVLNDFEDACTHDSEYSYIRDCLSSIIQSYTHTESVTVRSFATDILCRLKGREHHQPRLLGQFVPSVEEMINSDNAHGYQLTCQNAWVSCNAMQQIEITAQQQVCCMCISDDSEYMVLGCKDGSVEMYHLNDGRRRSTWQMKNSKVNVILKLDVETRKLPVIFFKQNKGFLNPTPHSHGMRKSGCGNWIIGFMSLFNTLICHIKTRTKAVL